MHTAYWLLNVRLETGHEVENGAVTGTKTDLFRLRIVDGKITAITRGTDAVADDSLPQIDARGLLALPPFIEKHCHLDKTLLGDRWRPVRPAANIFERFEIEAGTLPKLKTTMKERAETLLDILLRAGSTHVRTHVDLYPDAGLRHLEAVQEALAAFEGKLTSEIVAFPQHGLLRSQSAGLVRKRCATAAGLSAALIRIRWMAIWKSRCKR